MQGAVCGRQGGYQKHLCYMTFEEQCSYKCAALRPKMSLAEEQP